MRSILILSSLVLPSLALAQNQAPVVTIEPNYYEVFLGDAVTLNGSATDPDGDEIIEWEWEVDSAPADSLVFLDTTMPTPSFAADTLGPYTLILRASDGYLWSEPAGATVIVVANQDPTAVATASPLSGPAPLLVTFDGSESSDPEGGVLEYYWSFDDGSVSTEVSPVHEYTGPGVYRASLKVTDDHENADYDEVEITVTPPNTPPEAAPTATPSSGSAPLEVQLYANASDAETDPLTYLWDFGDEGSSDNSSTLADPGHVYETAGTYTVWLTVSDGQGEVSASLTIVVSPAPLLSTRRATVMKRWPACRNKGAISYWADFDLEKPGPDDVISLTFDGIRLFEQPFSAFRPGLLPNVYVMVGRRLVARINFNTNRLFVMRGRVSLRKFDNSDSVDVELLWGTQAAVDQFVMTEVRDNFWVYKKE